MSTLLDIPERDAPSIPITEICAVLQVREFLEDRYYQSESRGYNVGDDYTTNHWVESGHAMRFRIAFNENAEAIAASCADYCGRECKVYALHRELGRKNGILEDEIYACPLPSAQMHELLEKRRV